MKITLDIHTPKPESTGRVPERDTTHSHTTDLPKWLDRKMKEFPTGTYVVAHLEGSTLHYQLKSGRDTYWDLLRQVVGP